MTFSATASRDSLPTFVPRQRDRRLGLGELLRLVARGVLDDSEAWALRGVLEDALRRVVPARSIRVRDGQGRLAGRRDPADPPEAVVFSIPGVEETTQGVLEARFDPICGLGEWDFQLLETATHVTALVLEIERARLQLGRAGVASRARQGRQDDEEELSGLVGSTPALHGLRHTISRVADTDFTVLLEGESGVGKELVARQIHESSRRKGGPFVAINCAALVETLVEAELFGIEERTATGVRGRRGKFEHADGGTLFLDEVSDLSLSAQAKLLRAIQDLAVERVGGIGSRRVDIRIVAASNRSLRELVDRKHFRPDLFYRLSGVDIRVPTLRERRADIPVLAEHFLRRHRATRPLTLSSAASDALMAYDWPGNVRELERAIERTVALAGSGVVELEDLPPAIRGEHAVELQAAAARRDTMRAWTSRYARLIYDRCERNKRQTFRVLDISYHTLVSYLNYQTEKDEPGSGHSDSMPGAQSADDLMVESPNEPR